MANFGHIDTKKLKSIIRYFHEYIFFFKTSFSYLFQEQCQKQKNYFSKLVLRCLTAVNPI